MRRIALIALLLVAAPAAFLTAGAGADDVRSYRIEMLNAFGIYKGSDVRIAGVRAGIVTGVDINEAKRAEATIELDGDLADLGEETTCTTEPQSLIAEYFIDCTPAGDPMPDGAMIPAERVEQAIQPDLLFNTFRESYRERTRIIVNELGTALASNEENLNDALRLAVPALGDFKEVTGILARQREELARLNVGAERVIGRLAERRDDVVSAVAEGRDAAEAAAGRRADLATDVDRLDDFLAELRPTLGELGETARAGAPLLASLRTAAPGLDELSSRLPGFAAAGERAIGALGRAAVPGRRALAHGRDEIDDLARAGRDAPVTAEILGDLVADLDDPRRAVEQDARAARSCNDPARPCYSTGREAPTGYTGLEALLNYVYYQSGAINQFDSFGHFLQFNISDAGGIGECGTFNAGPEVPARGGGTTTDVTEVANCVSWVGKRQPDINFDLGLPRYDNSVCPNGSTDLALCDPSISTHDSGGRLPEGGAERLAGGPADGSGAPAPTAPTAPTAPAPSSEPGASPAAPGDALPGLPPPGEAGQGLEDLLGLPGDAASGLGKGPAGGNGGGRPNQDATEELLDFLYGS
jgi:phospholipid/cholesterol/gamma-HCH transport system substrate-binding protein